jgi:CHAT domain-containing protein
MPTGRRLGITQHLRKDLAKKIARCLVVVAVAVSAFAQHSPLPQQIADHEQKLAQARASQNKHEEAVELNTLANLYRQAGQPQKGLDACNQALQIEQSAGSRGSIAFTQNVMGRIYTDLGDEQKAMDLFNQALPVWRQSNNRAGEASTLNNMGRAFNNLGQRERALDTLNQALILWQELGNHVGEASTLDNLGRTYVDMGESKQALDYLNKALPLWSEEGEHGGAALTLNNLGMTYTYMGQLQKALESYGNALPIWRELGNRQGEAAALNYMGSIYSALGQKQQAIDHFNQALPIWREVGNLNGVALALLDIGRDTEELGRGREALDFYNQALPIWRETQNRRGEAATLNNMGGAHAALGDENKALEMDFASLALWREVRDVRGEAFALASIGKPYSDLGQPQRALPHKLAALALAKTAGDPDIQGSIDTSLMMDFRSQQQTEEAILFGLEGVNAFQQMRKNIAGLGQELQAGFAQSKSGAYRTLAELLVETNRLSEAEQVLDLLKEQELKEVVLGAGNNPEARIEPLHLTHAQQATVSQLDTSEMTASGLTDLSTEYAALQAKPTRSAAETAQMQALEGKIEAGNAEVADFFKKTLYPELAHHAGVQDANAVLSQEKLDVSRLQNALAGLGPRVIGIRLLLGDEHGYAMVITAKAREKFELGASPEDLRKKVAQVRDDLQKPSSDPKPHLAELYAMVIAPFSQELTELEHGNPQKGPVPTLLWSLDGVMRYLPMAALYDGHRYLAERFNNVLFTPESYGHIATGSGAGQPAMRILALGLSKSYGGLPALPGVMPELDSVAHDPAVPESHGPLDGVLLSDEHFTYEALKAELGAGSTFPVVHIASHFVLEAGGGTEPYLMLGGESTAEPNGYPLSLSTLENSTISFVGTRLLTLSACSTGKGDVAKDGLEMDSLGMIAQQKGADAVVATLWDVNDASTGRIMSDFYTRWVKDPSKSKAEALREAQLALLHGPSAVPSTKTGRGIYAEDAAASAQGGTSYAHPFYWAPYVLIGNYQ